MAMTDQQKREIMSEYTGYASRHHDEIDFTKSDLLTAITDVESWLNSGYNGTPTESYRSALGTTVDSNTTKKQKMRLFKDVVNKMWGLS